VAPASDATAPDGHVDGGAVGVDWDEWTIPNSQVDVTAGAPNLESYADLGDGTVTDNVTGLMWQKSVSITTYALADALVYCDGLPLAGRSDWRVPTQAELHSLVDFGQADPSINGTYFPGTPSGFYFWSSTLKAGSSSYAWTVNFGSGNTALLGASTPYYVRCVR
jgi:hypothetical protein